MCTGWFGVSDDSLNEPCYIFFFTFLDSWYGLFVFIIILEKCSIVIWCKWGSDELNWLIDIVVLTLMDMY